MDIVAVFALLNGLLGLILRLTDSYQPPPTTPEEVLQQWEELKARVKELHDEVMAYMPIDTENPA